MSDLLPATHMYMLVWPYGGKTCTINVHIHVHVHVHACECPAVELLYIAHVHSAITCALPYVLSTSNIGIPHPMKQLLASQKLILIQ